MQQTLLIDRDQVFPNTQQTHAHSRSNNEERGSISNPRDSVGSLSDCLCCEMCRCCGESTRPSSECIFEFSESKVLRCLH